MALYGIQYGIFVGWSSPNIVLLTSDQSPLPSGKITTGINVISFTWESLNHFKNLFYSFAKMIYLNEMPYDLWILVDEATWTAALKSLGFLLSCTMFGFIASKFGRKWPLVILAIPLSVRDAILTNFFQ